MQNFRSQTGSGLGEPGQGEGPGTTHPSRSLFRPVLAWKWQKWTFGFWRDPANNTHFGIDFGPLEVVWRMPGYRP